MKNRIINNGIYLLSVISIMIIIVHIALEKTEQIKWFNVILNLAYSYLAAFVFYLFQVFFPEQRRRKLAKTVLMPDIENVLERIGFFASFVEMIMIIEDDNVTIYGNEEKIFYSKYRCDGQVIHEYKNYREVLQNFVPQLKETISRIKGNTLYEYLDERIVDLFAEFESENIATMSDIGKLYPICRTYQDACDDYDKIKNYYLRLSELINKRYDYELHLMNDEEKETYQKDIETYKRINEELNTFLKHTTVTR